MERHAIAFEPRTINDTPAAQPSTGAVGAAAIASTAAQCLTFGGYSVAGYDADSETLVLVRDERRCVIGLRSATIKESRIALSGSIRFGLGEEAEAHKVVLLFDRESAFPWGPGTTFFVTPKRRGDGNIEYAARWEMKTDDGETRTLSAPRVVTRPDGPFVVSVGQLGFELKP